jgi:hypothetical protein
MFDEDPHRTWGDNSGPTHGHSISLHLRSYYVSYMGGANVVVAEGGALNCFKAQQPGPDGTLPLSTLGQEAARFYRFTRRHPNRGIPYAPIALLLPFDHGIYPGFGPKLAWNVFPYAPGDQRVLDALNVFFPGSLGDPEQPERADRQPGNPSWTDPEYMHTEALRLVACPYGDIADVLLSNARSEVLKAYAVLILAGEHVPNQELIHRLDEYVAHGGTLVLTDAERNKGVLPASLAARLPMPPQDGYARARYGRGVVVVLAPGKAGMATAERPLAKALGCLQRELIPLDVSGQVETLYNRTAEGWIVTIVNNEGVTKTFREPPVVDPKATQTVRVIYRGRGKIHRAILWDADTDQDLEPTRIQVTVPPGEVRMVSLSL